MANARSKAEQADTMAAKANSDSDQARVKAKTVAPEFHQPGTEILKKRLQDQSMGAPPVADYSILKVNNVNHSSGIDGDPVSLGNPSKTNSLADGKPGGHNLMSALVSSVLDTSLAESSTQIAQNLHHLDDAKPQTSRLSRQTSVTSSPANPQPIQQQRMNFLQKIPPEQAERFSQLLNSTVVNDHFDQYGTLKEDSGLGRDFAFPDETVPHGYTPDHSSKYNHHGNGMYPGAPIDRSPDSGVSDSEDLYRSAQSRPIQRRKTLPSIIKRVPSFSNKSKSKPKAGERVQSHESLAQDQTDTYIIENGIRKRVKAEVYAAPEVKPEQNTPVSSDTEDSSAKPTELPKRYLLEGPQRGKRGSLPDVSACRGLQSTAMQRRDLHVLSQRRRAELRIQQEEDERRRQQEIVLRLGDFKEWVQERQLLMLVIALNVSLATMFFNLLT